MQAPSRARALEPDAQPGRLGFLSLIPVLAASAAILYRIAGLPHLPARLPTWLEILVTLRGSDVPLGALGYLFTTAAWLVWLWIAGTLVLQLVLLAVERVSDGAAGVRIARQAVNAITLPLVRRTAEALFGGMLLVSVAAQSAPIAAAAPATAPIAAISDQAVSSQPASSSQSTAEMHYIVQPGDNLWLISRRFYATGTEYSRLVEANVGRQMADGRVFTREGVLQPGWVLRVPLPSTAVEEVSGKTFYTVEPGDSLSGIAARLLGDETRWPEIFQVNADKPSAAGQRVLTDPNVIWPGLRLELPVAAAPANPQPDRASASGTAAPAPASPQPTLAVPSDSQAEPASALASAFPRPVPSTAVPRASTPAIHPGPALLPAAYMGGAAALAAAAGGAVLARRRFRRSLSELPAADEVDVPVQEGFADADTGQTFRRRMAGADVEPVQLLAEHVQRFLEEEAVPHARVLAARHGRSSAALTIACSFLDQVRVIELAADFGRRLGAQVQALANADQDVIWQLSGLNLMNLPASPEMPYPTTPCLMPVGLLPNKQVLHGNWQALGSVLVAGLAGGGADLVMSSLLSALSARRRPEQLQLWTVGTERGLPVGLLRFPHQAQACIDPADEQALSALAERLNDVLNVRIDGAGGEPANDPEIVVVVEELSEIACIWERLEPVAAQGPAYGIRFLAAAEAPHLLSPDIVVHFSTRLILQTLDGDQGMLLAGQPDTAELRTGELLVRLDGRRPARVRGFRLRAEYLDELAAMMMDAYGTEPLTNVPAGLDMPTEWGPDATEPEAAAKEKAEPVSGTAVDDAPLPAERVVAEEPIAAAGQAEVIAVPDAADSTLAETPRAAMQTMLPLGHPEDTSGPSLEVEPNPERDSAVQPARRILPAIELLNRADRRQPVQVECFGSLRVLYGDRDLVAEDGGAHHKAWELMAFLSARPNGVVSREKLLDALWPDLELDRAENALRQIRFRLKNFLAQHVPEMAGEIIRSERDGTCRLNPELAGSDVQRFWELTRAMPRLEAAEAAAAYDELSLLYRNDLLVDPCFEWVHNRESGGLSLQERFREEFRRLTKHVARLNQESGRPERAVPLYRRLLLAEPTLEDVARELYRCYEQLGDRAALIREHRHLRQAIQQMFADPDDPEDSEIYDPEQETIAVYDEALAAIERASARPAETA